MDVHKNAKLTPVGREIMVGRALEGGQSPSSLAGC
jgi:hypothetical protein